MIDACPEPAVLFFDVDGTLTSFDPDDMTDKDFNAIHPSKAVVDAFGRLRNAGHRAFICTGRPLWLVADGLRALNPAGIVAMAGATLEVEGRVVHEDCFDEDIVEELARRIIVAGGEALFETNGATYSLEPVGVEQSFLLGAGVVHGVDQMRVDGRLRVGKVCINASDLARVANGDGFIDREFELCNTGGQNRELSPKGIDKGVGVARVSGPHWQCAHLWLWRFGQRPGHARRRRDGCSHGQRHARGQGGRRLRDRRCRTPWHRHSDAAFWVDLINGRVARSGGDPAI